MEETVPAKTICQGMKMQKTLLRQLQVKMSYKYDDDKLKTKAELAKPPNALCIPHNPQ